MDHQQTGVTKGSSQEIDEIGVRLNGYQYAVLAHMTEDFAGEAPYAWPVFDDHLRLFPFHMVQQPFYQESGTGYQRAEHLGMTKEVFSEQGQLAAS